MVQVWRDLRASVVIISTTLVDNHKHHARTQLFHPREPLCPAAVWTRMLCIPYEGGAINWIIGGGVQIAGAWK